MIDQSKSVCPFYDSRMVLRAPQVALAPCGECGFELPATDEFFYRRGNGTLRRECKMAFRAAKNARADRDRDHYREVARRSYRKADGAEAKRRARQANPTRYEKIAGRYESANRGRHKARYYRDVEATREANRAAYRADPEPRIASTRKWQAAHPEETRLYVEQTRARRLRAPGIPPTPQEWADKLRWFQGRCAYCFKRDRNLQQDHVVALGRGGTHDIGNVVPACGTCNHGRGGKHAKELWVWLDIPRPRPSDIQN
jgi:hypothetical protein